jgi:hypothetical protein
VIYFSKEIDVWANWDVEQVLMFLIPEPKRKRKQTASGFRVIVSRF